MDDCGHTAPLPASSEFAQSENPLIPSSTPESSAAVQPTRHLKLRRAICDQVRPVPARLEELLPSEHLPRLIWRAAERLDLSAFCAPIGVEAGERGQAATGPLLLVALWLYATSQGVTSARVLAKLCTEHLAHIWVCSGVSLSYHTFSDIRVWPRYSPGSVNDRRAGSTDARGLGRV